MKFQELKFSFLYFIYIKKKNFLLKFYIINIIAYFIYILLLLKYIILYSYLLYLFIIIIYY